jgi:predicted MFS family arabinose efflux permease
VVFIRPLGFYVALSDTFGCRRHRRFLGSYRGRESFASRRIPPDRFGTKIVCGGCLALSLGLLRAARRQSFGNLHILWFDLRSRDHFIGVFPAVFLVFEWFASNRASAIGFVYAGTGVGILLLAPLSEWLFSNWGWPRAFQTFSGIVLIALLPLAGMFYQHGPFGEKLRSKKESKIDDNRWTAKLALQSMQFWLLFFARICAASGTTVIVTHQVAHVVDVGYSKFMAASIFGLAGITSSFGRVVFGFIADLLTKQAAYTLNILMTMIGVGALMILRDPSQAWLLYVYVVFFGIGFGSRAVIFSALTADIFSGKVFGSIVGYSTVAVGVGGALGSWLGGAFYDWTGSYLVSFALSALVLGCSDVCIWLAAVPSVPNRDKRLFPQNPQ